LDRDELLVIEKLVITGLGATTLNNPSYEQAMTALAATDATSDATMTLKINSTAMYKYGQINLKYAYPRQTTAVPSMAQSCKQVTLYTNANQEELTKLNAVAAGNALMQYEQGNGYDMKEVEYKAAHWRNREVAPMGTEYFTENGYKYQVDETKKYHQYILNRGNVSQASQEQHMDAMSDIFILANDAPNVNGFTAGTPGTGAAAFIAMLA
jgi:hypothetical protein